DGKYVVFQTNRGSRLAVVGVASLDDGKILPFEIRVEITKPSPATLGRARWISGGRAIAFLGQDAQGRTGVYVQRFAPGEGTAASRAPLAGFGGGQVTESFDVAPGDDRVVLAEWEQRFAVVAATGLE